MIIISNLTALFGSIPELVAHYSKKSDGLCVNLRTTCLITRPKTASVSEEANETLEVDRSFIWFDKKLGEGKFGEVWQACIATVYTYSDTVYTVAIQL